MDYASERLFNGYVRQNMAKIASTIKATEIMLHLPCLSQTDREEIEATRQNTFAVVRLMECLRRRTNWVNQFITALERLEHRDLASEIRAAYQSLLVHRHPRPPEHPVQASLRTQPAPRLTAISGEQRLTPVNTEPPGAAAPSQNPPAPAGHSLPGTSSLVPVLSDTLPPSLPQASKVPAAGPAVSPPALQVSPARLAVQDKNPPAANATQQPVENSDPTVNQAHPAQGGVAQQPGRFSKLSARADCPAAPSHASGPAGEAELLSKPGTLRSCNARIHRPSENAAFPAHVTEEPYSGNTERLQVSSSVRESSVSAGVSAPSHNEYPCDSAHQSLLSHQVVRVSVGSTSEAAAPFLDHAGRAPQASNERPSVPPLQSYSPPGSEIEQAITGPSFPRQQQSNPGSDQRAAFPNNLLQNHYIPAAAIAGLSVLVALWRLKK